VHLPLHSSWNGRRVGLPDAGEGMDFPFGQHRRPPGAHAAGARRQHRRRGTVSNADLAKGWSCIAEQRALEIIDGGARRPATCASATPSASK
jgi:fumarylacetoacetate (FAA) hydrolase